MLKQLSKPGVKICQGYQAVLVIPTRNRNKYQGKKNHKYDVVQTSRLNVPWQPHEDFEKDEWLPRRLTYMPVNMPWAKGIKKRKPWLDRDRDHTLIPWKSPPVLENEWREKAVYPEIIKDPTIRHVHTSYITRTKFYKDLQNIPIDEMQMKLSKITRTALEFRKPWIFNYGGRPIAEYITRTHLVRDKWPESYNINDVDESLVKMITPILLDSVRVNYFHSDRSHCVHLPLMEPVDKELKPEKLSEINFFQEINTLLSTALLPNNPHLADFMCEVDADIRSWWYASQLPKPVDTVALWKRYDKIDQFINYRSPTPLQLRVASPLPTVVPSDHELCTKSSIPKLTYHPIKVMGHKTGSSYPFCSPGFWPSDPACSRDFPFLQMFGRVDEKYRIRCNENIDYNDGDDVVACKAIIGSFAWLNSLAFYHGFTPFHEITYPFINQGLVTDGQRWHFYIYQMNAHSFHSDIFEGDGPRNICWLSPEIKLFESYENGKFSGINDDIARYLIKMYSKAPVADSNVVYRPYVGEDNREEKRKKVVRYNIQLRAEKYHSKRMESYKIARKKSIYRQMFIDNPDYDTTLFRAPMRPRLVPAEQYYKYWKY